MSIYYPFPIDSFHEYPHFIQLIEMSRFSKAPKFEGSKADSVKKTADFGYSKRSGGIGFSITIDDAHKTDSLNIIYRQRVYHNQGRYILTTTKYWNEPFVKAAYSISFPSYLTLSYWSFTFDSIAQNNGRITYYAYRKNFKPEEDMIMKWNCE